MNLTKKLALKICIKFVIGNELFTPNALFWKFVYNKFRVMLLISFNYLMDMENQLYLNHVNVNDDIEEIFNRNVLKKECIIEESNRNRILHYIYIKIESYKK